MVYNCQFCVGWFPKDILSEALSSNAKIISCPYCGQINEMEHVKASHVSLGYNYLENGNFFSAAMEFGEALKRAEHLDISAKAEFLDAYLGRALAQHSVQVIYNEEIADPDTEPEVNCYLCNETYLEDSDDYQTALSIAKRIIHEDLKATTINRVSRFAKKIDGIKRVYDRKKENNEEIQLFIACEDNTKDSEAGLIVANKLRDMMPDGVNKVYIQDPEGLSYEQYEGELLYAIHHATCMLVVVDNDIDSRLMNLYSRYYWATKTAEGTLKQKHLGFVRYRNKIQIHLPEHNFSQNIFEFEERFNIRKFVAGALKIYLGARETQTDEEKVIEEKKKEEFEQIESFEFDSGLKGAPIVEGPVCRFGTYPQRLVTDPTITSEFTKEPRPSVSDSKGWNVMFTSRTGTPYTWYMDKVIGEKKYRAVFFVRFREVFTVRPTNISPSVQRISNYLPSRIFVFSHDDIEWNILDLTMDTAVLVSSVGLDCREFNNCQLCSEWGDSSIRKWLNEDFYNTAFTEEQKQFLWQYDRPDEHVAILDKSLYASNKRYCDTLNSYNICGSDYFRCIGGFCDKNISNFWIKASTDQADRAAAVQPHHVMDVVPQCVDNTAVSVLPLIRVQLVKK